MYQNAICDGNQVVYVHPSPARRVTIEVNGTVFKNIHISLMK